MTFLGSVGGDAEVVVGVTTAQWATVGDVAGCHARRAPGAVPGGIGPAVTVGG